MKAVFALVAAMLAAPLAAEPSEPSIRLADEQSTILASADIRYLLGEGDMLFVQGRSSHWYQIDVNEGCLDDGGVIESMNFSRGSSTERIDRFTRVLVNGRDGLVRSCRIDSIRRVEDVVPHAGQEAPTALG